MAIKTTVKLDSRTSAVSSSGAGMRGENQSVRDSYDAQQHQNGR